MKIQIEKAQIATAKCKDKEKNQRNADHSDTD